MEIRTDGRAGWIELTHEGVHLLAKGGDPLRDRLTSALAAAGDDPLPDVLTDELAAGSVRQAPDFAIVDEADGRVLVRGSARVLLTGVDESSREVVSPVRAPWVDEDLAEQTVTAVLSTGEPEPVEPVVAPATPEPTAPADDGSADGEVGGVVADTDGAAGELAADPPQFVDGHLVSARVAAAAAAVPVQPAHAGTDISPDAVDDAPGGADHRSGPSTGILPVTGAAPEASEREPSPSSRLVLSTGEVVDLDRGVLLGRAPRAAAAIGVVGDAHLVRVPSPDNEISRSHVEVYPEGESIIVRDLGSTNGTTVAAPGEQPRRMAPGEPQPIEPGTTIRLAGQVSVVLGEE